MRNPMLKFTIGVGALTLILSTTSFGQSFFGSTLQSSNNQSTNQTTPSTAPTGQVVPPSQFQAAVKQKSQQTQSDIAKQATEGLLKAPPPPTFEPLPPLNSSNGNGGDTKQPNTNTPTSKQTQPVRPTQPIAPPPPARITPPPTQRQQQPSNQPPPPKQRDVYTGFGSGQQNTSQPSNQGSTSSDGGWDITY